MARPRLTFTLTSSGELVPESPTTPISPLVQTEARFLAWTLVSSRETNSPRHKAAKTVSVPDMGPCELAVACQE